MAYFLTTISHGTPGIKTVTIGFQPTGMRITAGQKFGISQAFAHKSVGVSDGTNQVCDTFFQDTSGGKTERSTTKLVSHWERVAGTITEKVAVSFDSFTPTQVKYNVTTADANYQLLVEAWG